VALEVGIVGAPGAGKTTLFTALTGGGGGEYGKANLAMAAIADPRLDALARVVAAKKVTPAALRVQDVPGSGPALLGNLRQVDALLAVLDGFSPDADPAAQLEELELELLVADRDHVEARLERVTKQAKSGDPKLRAEAEQLGELLASINGGTPLAGYPRTLPPGLEPLTTKPLLTVENGPSGIDLELEAELAALDPAEAASFREGGRSALEEVVRLVRDSLDLITFFTAGEKETRAWPLRRGSSALDAAAAIHSDIARGFIRAEVIDWKDLVDAGSHREAARRGLQRVETKTYVVADGDVLNVRFNV
jgi:ribosome-binding ATPase